MSIGPRFIAFPALVFILFLTGCALQTTATPGSSSISGYVLIDSGGAFSVTGEYSRVAGTA